MIVVDLHSEALWISNHRTAIASVEETDFLRGGGWSKITKVEKL